MIQSIHRPIILPIHSSAITTENPAPPAGPGMLASDGSTMIASDGSTMLP
jgi:hypothetical protein